MELIRLCRTGRLKCPLQIPPVHETRRMHCPRQNRILYLFQHLQFRVRLRTHCIHPPARFQFLVPILPCRKLYRNIRVSFFPQPTSQTHHALDPTGVIVQHKHDAAHLRILFQRAEQGSFRCTVQRQIVALPPILWIKGDIRHEVDCRLKHIQRSAAAHMAESIRFVAARRIIPERALPHPLDVRLPRRAVPVHPYQHQAALFLSLTYTFRPALVHLTGLDKVSGHVRGHLPDICQIPPPLFFRTVLRRKPQLLLSLPLTLHRPCRRNSGLFQQEPHRLLEIHMKKTACK